MFTRLGLPMNHYTISSQNTFPRSADFEFQLILKPLDISYHQIFLQKSTQNFEIHRRVPRAKKNKLTKFKKNTHTHLSLSLSTCRSADAIFTLMCLHQSLSLSLSLQTQFGSRSDPNGIQDRMFRQFKNVCMR